MQIFRLKGKQIQQVGFEDLDTKSLSWIRLVSPGSNELEKVSSRSGIPYSELQESIEETERPRMLVRKYLEVIYRAPHSYQEEGLQTMEVYFYIKDNLFITIEQYRNKIIERLARRCRTNRARYMFSSHGKLLYHILDEINDEFLYFIDRIASNLESVKKQGFAKLDITQLYYTNLTSAYFNRSIIANLEVLNQLRKSHYRKFIAQDREAFHELYLDKLQILDTEKVQRDVIRNLIDIRSISSTVALNTTMKRLAALALIVAVPTMVSGMYGMNVALPLGDYEYAFWVLSGIMGAVCIALFIFMRRVEWI